MLWFRKHLPKLIIWSAAIGLAYIPYAFGVPSAISLGIGLVFGYILWKLITRKFKRFRIVQAMFLIDPDEDSVLRVD